MAFFVSDTVDSLDLKAFYAPYEGDGRRKQPYEPAMMLKVLIYGYATGTFSSRQLARKLHEDIAFRVLAAENFPAHRTLCEFRRRHLDDFEALFVQVVRIAREVGLVKLGTVAVDGSKVKANASKHKAMSYGRMREEEKRLRKEIRSLTRQARQVDAQEDRKYGKDRTGKELPAELERRRERLAKIQAAKARLEERQRDADRARGRSEDDDDEPRARGQGRPLSFGEPAVSGELHRSRQPDHEGFGRFSRVRRLDGESRIIVANGHAVSGRVGQLRPLLDGIGTNTGRTSGSWHAGYASEENLRSTATHRRVRGAGTGRDADRDGRLDPERQRIEKLKEVGSEATASASTSRSHRSGGSSP